MERVVEAILGQAAKRVDLPAAPPHVRTAGDVSAAVLAKLDGTPFPAPVAPVTPVAPVSPTTATGVGLGVSGGLLIVPPPSWP